MAISFVGSAVGSSSPNTGTTVDISGLVGPLDLILVAAAVGDTANNGLAAPTEGGYSRVPGVAATLYSNDVNDTNLDLYYKIADGTETSVSFAAVGGTNASNAAVVMVFRGVDTTTPFDTNANTVTGINTSNANPPSHNWSGAAGVWTVIAASTGHTGGATASFTFPTGYTTNAAQRAHNDTIDVLVGMGYKTSPSNPEDPAAFTASTIGTATDNAWAAVTMSLKEGAPPNQTMTPSAVAAAYSIAAPSMVKGGITKTPGPASAAFSIAAPSIAKIYRALPDAVAAVYSVATPTIQQAAGGATLTPSAIVAAYSIASPSLLKGGLTLTPNMVAAALSTVAPTLVKGGIVVLPAAITSALSVASPSLLRGARVLTPSPASGLWSVQTASVIIGAKTLSPGVVSAQFVVVDPTVSNAGGATTTVPEAVVATWSVPSHFLVGEEAQRNRVGPWYQPPMGAWGVGVGAFNSIILLIMLSNT